VSQADFLINPSEIKTKAKRELSGVLYSLIRRINAVDLLCSLESSNVVKAVRRGAQKPPMRVYESWFDGACWPNPNGHAASGAIVKLGGLKVFEHSEYIGTLNTSNNVAEYHGLNAVLRFLLEVGQCECVIYGDADMVIKQMNNEWKAGTLTKKEKSGKIPVRPRYYLPYHKEAVRLRDLQLNSRITFKWIPRAQNTEADELSTRPLRERGYRDNYTRRETEADRLDAAFEHAISK
jgi:ribonuclease HI